VERLVKSAWRNDRMKRDRHRRNESIERRLRQTFCALQGSKSRRLLRAKATRQFVFHMIDWKSDLELLERLYGSPNQYSVAAWERGVGAFLTHVIGHLLEACRLNGYISDPFDAIQQCDKARNVSEYRCKSCAGGRSRRIQQSKRARGRR
jgi:hypothetical protein